MKPRIRIFFYTDDIVRFTLGYRVYGNTNGCVRAHLLHVTGQIQSDFKSSLNSVPMKLRLVYQFVVSLSTVSRIFSN